MKMLPKIFVIAVFVFCLGSVAESRVDRLEILERMARSVISVERVGDAVFGELIVDAGDVLG